MASRFGEREPAAEAPGLDEIADPDVERAVGQFANLEGGREDVEQVARQGRPLADRRAIEALDLGIRTPRRHFGFDRVDGVLQAARERGLLEVIAGVEHGRPARAHCGTVKRRGGRARRTTKALQ